MNCIIFSGGTLNPARSRAWNRRLDTLLKTADLIIAADSGAGHLHKTGYLPHIIIGDLDSIDTHTLAFFKKKGVRVCSHPSRKNQTDTELCMSCALEQGADQITFLAATGTRLDHTLANILLLAKLADTGISARVLDAHNELFLVKDRLELTGTPGDLISLIPVSQRVEGVTIQGVGYPLSNHTLVMGSTLGISNYFTQKKAVITICSGMLIVARSMD
ncbi:MAG: thiamine diphosphokinase [Desulfotignum sp.]|nr:thiamine diphosphokinase [Desulfotignum sp.]